MRGKGNLSFGLWKDVKEQTERFYGCEKGEKISRFCDLINN